MDRNSIPDRSKINSYSTRPPTQSNHLKNPRKDSEIMKKSDIKDKVAKVEPKSYLKKS